MNEPAAEPEGVEIEASRTGSALAYVPNLLLGALEDLRSIAVSVSVLPDLARTLGSIEGRVSSLDDEVKKMRSAVESMGGDVDEMKNSVAPLESSLEDLQRAVHPLRRATGRIGRRVPPPAIPPEDRA